MTQLTPILEMFFQPIALAVMLVYLYGMIERTGTLDTRKSLYMGTIFGLASAVSMTMPMTLTEGIILDLRNLFVGIAAAYFGLLAGCITLMIAIAMRVAIGGDGLIYAIPAMAIAMGMGLLWRHFFWPSGAGDKKALPTLGLMISVYLLVGSFLPSSLRYTYFIEIVPVITLMDVLGAYILGGLLHREMKIARQIAQMEEDATTDPLTKLINRRQLETIVKSLPMPGRIKNGRALMFFDIDDFKGINDTYGHSVGDAALQELTVRIGKCLRPTDHFARMGGDEFVVILPDATLQEAKQVAERCRAAIANAAFHHEDIRFAVSISLGVRWMDTPVDFANHLSDADNALYEAKSKGRNRIEYHNGDEDLCGAHAVLKKAS